MTFPSTSIPMKTGLYWYDSSTKKRIKYVNLLYMEDDRGFCTHQEFIPISKLNLSEKRTENIFGISM